MRTSMTRASSALLAAAALLGVLPVQAGQWRDGAHVYEKVCRHCHDAGVGPTIKGRQLPPQYIERVVRYGNRAMPAFRPSEIDDAALAAIARMVSESAVLAGQQAR